ncbi:FCS-Like Zinc finger 6 [Ziziphus jujuba]|uniref:FCS-Like Zinc finger 6 n=1 Tax=Ziziphus jujuba TaxID=326968 RepID=A0ABM3ITV5_ZIZJJ|nr:FCS-Like Zinc finger 6 [Ziziphus jujuba]
MLLGKRTRPEIRRTTSMTGINFDLTLTNGEAPQQHQSDNSIINHGVTAGPEGAVIGAHNNNMNSGTKTSSYQVELLQQHHHHQHHFFSMLSPRNQRSSSDGDFIETAHFLRTCGLCKRRLTAGRDIYMYRGDTAFCSLECREQQMKQDEGKEKFKASLATKNEDRHASTSTTSSKSSSGKSQTVAAA